MLELFILQRKLMGPCWLKLTGVKKQNEFRKTWSKLELIIDSPKQVECGITEKNKEAPPMTGLALAIKTCRSKNNTNEIAMISCLTHN